MTFWFTGLSGAGKTTLALALQKYLAENDITSVVLDGDEMRNGLNKNLGFSTEDRFENIRRISEVAKVLVNSKLIVIVATISPLISMRQLARDIVGESHFKEIYINTSLATCEKRDVKGLYQQVRAGNINQFTGISSVYEPPLTNYFEINSDQLSLEDCIQQLVKFVNTEINAICTNQDVV